MALIPLSHLLQEARAGGYAVGYFEAWDLYSFEAVLEAAEEERSPVVLGFGGMMMDQNWLNRFGVEPLGAYGRVMADRATVPCGFLLNEVWDLDHAVRGVASGFNAVMLNSCHLPYGENVALTRQLVEIAHPQSVQVQAELGTLPDFGGDEPGELTNPDEARDFVSATEVDCLAVSVGNVHQQITGVTTTDLARLQAIRDRVEVPLVIHGGSGFPDAQVRDVIRLGVALFHVGTVLKRAYLESASVLISSPEFRRHSYQAQVGSRKSEDFLMPGKRAIKSVVKPYMQLYGSSGCAR
ncbi:MAG: class II fructose-bisphosphate aldolase [Armatimonadetes bacterium]|nr:class II fructose-bisphosphate aldolase [Armatimonadota bacterium]